MKKKLCFVLLSFCFVFCGFSTCVKAPISEQACETQPAQSSQKEILQERAVEIAASMSLTEKIYQLLVLSVSGNSLKTVRAGKFRFAPGGVILFKFNFADTAETVYDFITAYEKNFEANTKKNAPVYAMYIPPFFATDNEGGAVFRTSRVTSHLPFANDIAKNFSPLDAQKLFTLQSHQMAALRLSMNLAPICETGDFTTAVMGKRLFSDDTASVADYTTRFINAHKADGIACVVKHFPGSGNADTHRSASKITGSYNDVVTACESFRAPLRAAQAVMLSHTIVECFDDKPFCLSPAGIDFLKTEFRYDGIVMSDDIIMKALRPYAENYSDLAYHLISAGCDMILYSANDFPLLVDGLLAKAQTDEAFSNRITEAVTTVLRVKLENGLIDENGEPRTEESFNKNYFDAEYFYDAKEKANRLLLEKNLH